MKTYIKYILFSLCLFCMIYAGYLYYHYKSLPKYQTKYNVETEKMNGIECAIHYAYYHHHIYKSVCSDDDYTLGEEIGKAEKEKVYAIKEHKNMIAIQGVFMSVPIYFKKISG